MLVKDVIGLGKEDNTNKHKNHSKCNDKNNLKGDEDMGAMIEKIQSPADRLKESLNEYRTAERVDSEMMSFDEMMKRLDEDDR